MHQHRLTGRWRHNQIDLLGRRRTAVGPRTGTVGTITRREAASAIHQPDRRAENIVQWHYGPARRRRRQHFATRHRQVIVGREVAVIARRLLHLILDAARRLACSLRLRLR